MNSLDHTEAEATGTSEKAGSHHERYDVATVEAWVEGQTIGEGGSPSAALSWSHAKPCFAICREIAPLLFCTFSSAAACQALARWLVDRSA